MPSLLVHIHACLSVFQYIFWVGASAVVGCQPIAPFRPRQSWRNSSKPWSKSQAKSGLWFGTSMSTIPWASRCKSPALIILWSMCNVHTLDSIYYLVIYIYMDMICNAYTVCIIFCIYIVSWQQGSSSHEVQESLGGSGPENGYPVRSLQWRDGPWRSVRIRAWVTNLILWQDVFSRFLSFDHCSIFISIALVICGFFHSDVPTLWGS